MEAQQQQQQQQQQQPGGSAPSQGELYDLPEDMTGGQKIIQTRYSFWYKQKGKQQQSKEDYESSIKQLCSFQTVEHFWRIYNHLQRADTLPTGTDIHLFREGIKPAWEDSNNARGGHWLIRLKKGLAARYWEELILAIIGEEFDVGNEICGAVVSVRYSEDIIYLWHRSADRKDLCDKIKETLKRVLKLPPYIQLDYRRHQESLSGIYQQGQGGSSSGGASFQRQSSWSRTSSTGSRGSRRFEESDGGLSNVLGKEAVAALSGGGGGGSGGDRAPYRNAWDRRGQGTGQGGLAEDKEKELSKWGSLRRGGSNVAAGPPAGGGGHHHTLSGPQHLSRYSSDDRDDRLAGASGRPASLRDGGGFMQANNRSDRDWSKLRSERTRTVSTGSDGKPNPAKPEEGGGAWGRRRVGSGENK